MLVSPRCLRSVAPMPATAAAQATLMHPGCSCSGVWPLTPHHWPRPPGLHSPIVQSQPARLGERPRLRLAASDWRLQAHSEPASACSTSPGHEHSFEGHRSQLTWAEGPWGSGGLTTSRTSGHDMSLTTLIYRLIGSRGYGYQE